MIPKALLLVLASTMATACGSATTPGDGASDALEADTAHGDVVLGDTSIDAPMNDAPARDSVSVDGTVLDSGGIDSGPVDVAPPPDVPGMGCIYNGCAPGLACCGVSGVCFDPSCTTCCTFPDAGTDAGADVTPPPDVQPPEDAGCTVNGCSVNQSCCGATGDCYDNSCLDCCGGPPIDSGSDVTPLTDAGCTVNGCAAGQLCCAATGDCYDSACTNCCGSVTDSGSDSSPPDDTGTDAPPPFDTGNDVPPPFDAGCTVNGCGAGQLCCAATGNCYSSSCLACCMSTFDAGSDTGTRDVTDVPPPPDASTMGITGRWRATQYVIHNADGTTLTLADSDTPISGGGVTYQMRVNGMLYLSSSRVSLNLGFLLNEHFFVDNNKATLDTAWSAYGVVAPGMLSGDTFDVPGGTTISFVENPDGTISQTDMTSGNVSTWTRMPDPLGVPTIYGQGQAQLWKPTSSAPFTAPRVALAWDLPGFGTSYVFTNDQAIAFGPFNTAPYLVMVSAPPGAALSPVGTTSVALAYVIVYDDTNRSGAYEAGADVLRGVSPFALAFRTPTPGGSAFASSLFQDLDPGFQVVHLQPDYSRGLTAPSPFDPTHPVLPDVAADTGPSSSPIPDIIM